MIHIKNLLRKQHIVLMIKAMAVALSSSGVVSHLHPPSSNVSVNRFLLWSRNASPCGVALPVHLPSRSVLVFARGKNRKGFATSSSSSPKKNKKVRQSHNS